MDSFLPPVIIEILASIKDFTAKKDKVLGGLKEIQAEGATTGDKLQAVGNKLAGFMILGAAGVATAAIKMSYDFQEALHTVGEQTNVTQGQLKQIGTLALQVSTETATSAKLILSGYTQLIKGGYSVSEATQAVGAAAMFAKTQNADLNTTLSAAIGIQAVHMAGTTGVANTMDIFTDAIKGSRLTADDLTTALSGKALSAFAAYHIDLKTATTLLAGFSNENMNGARSQLALKTGIEALDKPMYGNNGQLSSQAKLLQSVGINQATLAAEARKPGGMLTVLSQINQAWEQNATSTMKAQGINSFMTQLFGGAAGPAFTNLITQLPNLQKLFETMNKGGTNKSAFEEWLKTPAGAVANFTTTVENALTSAGNVLLPKLTNMLNDAMTWAKAHPSEVKAIGDALGVALGASLFVKLYKFASDLKGAISGAFDVGKAALKWLTGGTGTGTGSTVGGTTTDELIQETNTLLEGVNATLEKISVSDATTAGMTEKEVAEQAVADTELGVADIEQGAGVFAPLVGLALAAGGLTYLLAKEALKAPTAPNTYGSIQGLESWNYAAAGMRIGPKGATPGYTGIGSPNYNAGFSEDWVHKIIDTKKDKYGSQMVENAVLSKQQWEAIRTYFEKNHLLEFSKGEATPAFLNAVNNFMAANAQGKKNYSVVVNIKA